MSCCNCWTTKFRVLTIKQALEHAHIRPQPSDQYDPDPAICPSNPGLGVRTESGLVGRAHGGLRTETGGRNGPVGGLFVGEDTYMQHLIFRQV